MITKTQLYLLNKLPERIQKDITINSNGCWLYNKNMNRNGYGRVYADKKRTVAHKFVYVFLFNNSQYDDTKLLDHLCRARNCCNPTHVEPVTVQHNTHRGEAKLFKKKTGEVVIPEDDDELENLLSGYAFLRYQAV